MNEHETNETASPEASESQQLARHLAQLSDRLEQQQQSMLEACQDLRDELTVLTARLEQAEAQVAQQEEALRLAEEERAAALVAEPLEEQPPAMAVPVAEVATPVAVQAFPPVSPPAVIVGDSKLEMIIFGERFGNIPYLEPDRKELIRGLLAGDETAMALAGQMLIFRAANAETMPQLLKGLGEAYYEWRPQTSRQDDPMRDALIEELQQACETVGVNHQIELARPGDRFENKRHSAKQRGVEVTDVHGWIVLRENGSVYTKANVSVQ
ncbi:hypothetical protein [Lignipirellula cremea]|uniref:Uncharacterized protein n=1 Tax=Lignipirellula cremea TaxID=2528010 RepID=A0A518DTF5_9BACT|nr:hypothetical protein [Lignipirellula cremea]QDU95126.1 hypothetical protein Pla8534_29380 [Lignipirellula cremea]